jgi:putative endonuclease
MHSYFVYMMTNWNNTVLYIGVTNDMERRRNEHFYKLIPGFTNKYNLTKLVYFEETSDIESAILREKQLKGWKRDKKAALIESVNPNWDDLYEVYHAKILQPGNARSQDDNLILSF